MTRALKWTSSVFLLVCACACAAPPAAAPPAPPSSEARRPTPDQIQAVQLPLDQEAQLSVWFAPRGTVLHLESPSTTWTGPIYDAWHVEVGDLDGDGVDELLLGIWTRSPRRGSAERSKTVWVLRWEHGQYVPAWRGSALARPLVGFHVEGEGAAQLVATERLQGECSRAWYSWSGFGFVVDRRLPAPCP